jgi:glycosyltransferase involved in cell wall biosynthesis
MRILHIVNEGLFGGVLRVALAESHFMNMSGYSSYVSLLFNLRIPRDVLMRYHKAEVLFVKRNPIPQSLQEISNPVLREMFGKYLRKVVLTNKPDIVLLHNLTALPLAKYLKESSDVKLVLYVHNPTNSPSLMNFIRIRPRYSLNSIDLIDAVVTSSSKMKIWLRKLFDLDAYVVPPGCDIVTKPPESKDKIVLVPQRISVGKGVHVISRLLTRCRSKFVTIFAGSSHYSSRRAVSLIRGSGLRHSCIVMNPTGKELEGLYKRALCSITITREPFGMPIIESASYGTPPIAPKDAGASELFEHGVHGFFFDHEEAIPDYVDELVFNPELVMRMGYAGWKLCREKYTWQNHVMKLVDIIERL